METNELKFLVKLLGCRDYRSPLSAKAFNSIKGKEKIARDLSDRGLVDYSREIATVKLLPPGRTLLKMPKEELPLTSKELKVLENISNDSGKITPSKIAVKSLKSADRDVILQGFHDRGWIEVETKIKRQKAEVWLTERGLEHLRDDFIPKKGTNPVISLDMLTNYLRFLRKSLHQTTPAPDPTPMSQPTDGEILQAIVDLDQQLGTDNYLPIFHLRQKLQPPLSREELDQALYRLQRQDKIELSSLVEAIHYTPEQIKAGIPQDVGGPLFFIVLS